MKLAPRSPYIRAKVLTLGDSGVGKSCLVKRYCEKRKFISKYTPTVGVDYGVKRVDINGVELRVNFWDTSGIENFFEIRNEFFDNVQGVIIVFDVTNPASFQNIEKWLGEMKKYGDDSSDLSSRPVLVCVGNKIDLRKRRKVKGDTARVYARKRGFRYFETSTYTGDSVNDMFFGLFSDIVEKFKS